MPVAVPIAQKEMKKKKSELFRQFGGVEVEMETNGT